MTTDIHQIIVKPLMTEKTSRDQQLGKYWFVVAPEATKVAIRQAVEKIFKVKVSKVNVANLGGKRKRWGKKMGKTPDRRRAVVTLAPGEKIELAGT